MSDLIFAPIKIKKINDTLFDLGIKVEDLTEFLEKHSSEGWVHINLCKSKEKENWFAKLNTWKPTKNDDGIAY